MNNLKAIRYVEDVRRDNDVTEQEKELKRLIEEDRQRLAKQFEIFWNS